MSSNVASFEYPTEAVTVDVDDHHRKLIPEKDGVLTPSKCIRFILSPVNYGFTVPIMRPEKHLFLLRGVSSLIPHKTLPLHTKPITIRNNDVAMPVLLKVLMGRKEFILEASDNEQSKAALGWLTVHGHGTKTQMDAVSNLTKAIIDLETKKALCPEAAQVVEVETQKIVVIGATELQAEVVNASSQTGKGTAQFMSKFSVDYEMVVSTQNDGARPFEGPNNDDTDCSCCGCCFIM